jgi:hypothetical protein
MISTRPDNCPNKYLNIVTIDFETYFASDYSHGFCEGNQRCNPTAIKIHSIAHIKSI